MKELLTFTFNGNGLEMLSTQVLEVAQMGNNILIGSNVSVASDTKIGNNYYIGAGNSIINNFSIGNNILIDMGTKTESLPLQ